MPRGPQDLTRTSLDTSASFDTGFKQGVGMMKVVQEAQQRKKQDRDIEILSNLIGKDLKTLEALKVMSQYKIGIATADAAVAKQTQELAKQQVTGEFITQVPSASQESFDKLQNDPKYQIALDYSAALRKLNEDRRRQLIVNGPVGQGLRAALRNAKTEEEMDAIENTPFFEFMHTSSEAFQDEYEFKNNTISPPKIAVGEDGSTTTFHRNGTINNRQPKQIEGRLFNTEAEARAVAGPFGTIGFVTEGGVTKYSVKTINPRSLPPVSDQFGTLEEAGARLKELKSQNLDASISVLPNGMWGITSARTEAPDFGIPDSSNVVSNEDLLPGFNNASGKITDNGVERGLTDVEQAKLKPGSRFFSLKDGRFSFSTRE